MRSRWKAGDTIDLVVPQPLRTLSIDTENPNLAALMRGAVMYVGLNPWDGIGEQSIDLPGSLSPLSASKQAYRTVVAGRDLVFVPYFTIDTEVQHGTSGSPSSPRYAAPDAYPHIDPTMPVSLTGRETRTRVPALFWSTTLLEDHVRAAGGVRAPGSPEATARS